MSEQDATRRAAGALDQRPPRGAARWVFLLVGEAFFTIGALILLFCAYQLWWTGVQAGDRSNAIVAQIEGVFSRTPTPAPTTPTPDPEVIPKPAPGKGFALMYIPRIRSDVWGAPVVQGVTLDDLVGAIGHYPESQMPGQIGNFAVAAHRATNGELFRNIDALKAGDLVIVETASTWYTYKLVRDKITDPSDYGVILPVPNQPGVKPTKALITLTTCNPRWASYERWIWWGTLVSKRPHGQGPPPEVKG